MGNSNSMTTYYTLGAACLALTPTMPMLALPGVIGVMGGLVINCVNQTKKESPTVWANTGLVTKDNKVPRLLKATSNDNYEKQVYALPEGLSCDDLISKKDKLESAFKSKLKIDKTDDFNVVVTKIKSKYEKEYKINLLENELQGMQFYLGVDITGKLIILDLSGNEMHTGVFGSTGTGKSVCLNLLMTQFILKDIEVRVIDLKGGVEFAMYRKYPRLSKFAITVPDAEQVLSSTVSLMDKRYKKLFESECKSYKDYNAKHNNAMKPIIVLIDEYNALIKNKSANENLFALLSRARAANIICIICTQRPSHEVLPGTLKCNIKNFITFKVENETDSEIVLSQKGNKMAFKDLTESGEGLLKKNGTIIPFKGYFLTDDEILGYIKEKLTGKHNIPQIERKVIKEKTKVNKKKDIEKLESLI